MGDPYREGPPEAPFPRALGAPPERWVGDPLLSLGVAAAIVGAAVLSAYAIDVWPSRGVDDGPGFAITVILATALVAAVGARLGSGRPSWAAPLTFAFAFGSGLALWFSNQATTSASGSRSC